MYHKTIVEGRLEFGTAKSYDTILKMYIKRVESYHRNEIFLKVEDIFKEDTFSLVVERFVKDTITEKSFKNTISLLQYCSQFALSGTIRAWLLDGGNILNFELIEPNQDKSAVQSFLKGRKLIRVQGRQDEAIQELSKAIDKFDRHAQAYERRAKTCFILKKYSDSLRDYNKCIGIDPTIASAYYGRARIHLLNNDLDAAKLDFDQAIKKSVALEPVHWKSRRLKGYVHYLLNEYDKAIFELRLFTKRTFPSDDANFGWKRWGYYHYGLSLLANQNFEEAVEAFNFAAELEDVRDDVAKEDILRNRALSKKQAGKNGYIKDLKEAADLGDEKSSILLKEIKNI
jgi:tetratricopeptide (TPR) repeat protein